MWSASLDFFFFFYYALSMEDERSRTGLDATSVKNVISSDKLPLFSQAAQNTGFELLVTAREGQPHTFISHQTDWVRGKTRTVTIRAGELGITINKPAGQRDHSAFWNEYRRLRTEQSSPK